MKRFVCILVTGLCMVSAFGQSKSKTWEHSLYIGTFGYSYTYNLLFPVYESFSIGGGIGLCLNYPTYSKSVWYKNDVKVKSRRDHTLEAGLPVYLRMNYYWDRYYTNLDIGYNFGLIGVFPGNYIPGGIVIASFCSYNGFFAEPQFGYHLNEKYSVAVGALLHQGHCHENTHHDTEDSSEEVSVYKSKLFPSLTIRFARHF